MKNIWLVLLVIAALLVLTAESRKDRKPGKEKGRRKPKECTINCSNCSLAGTCLECDDGFAKIAISKRKNKTITICIPCSQQMKPRKVLDRDNSKCPAVNTTTLPCPENCSECDDGICIECDSGFALLTTRKNKTSCIPCGSGRNGKKVDRSQCDTGNCGKGCLTCTEGTCSECKDGYEMNPNKNKCKKKKDCGKGCLSCQSGVCTECKQGLTLSRNSKKCVKPCTAPVCKGKGKGKDKKKPRKGGKGKPTRRPAQQ